jgi:hypothetical protein
MIRFACRPLARLLAALCCLLATGCMGYRVGPVFKGDYKSVAVPMFKNKTLHPQLEAQITNAIIKDLQSDGTLRIESEDDADVVVTGIIVAYDRQPLRTSRDDTNIVTEYRIIITAEIEARNRRTGQTVIKRTKIKGQADTFTGSDLQSAELQVLPLVADDLAKQVVSLLVESW